MLPKKFGKSRKAIQKINKITTKKLPDLWVNYGAASRFENVYIKQLKNKPLKFLLKNKKENPNPQIMVLGAGFGNDIIRLDKYLKNNKINSKIDVFSLHKMIDLPFQKTIRKDYSREVALEELFKKDRSVLKKTNHKYNLVMAPLSVGVHTKYPVYNALISSLMLKKNGRLYYEVPLLKINTLKEINKRNKDVNIKTLFSKLKNFENIFNRMVSSYNKIYSTKLKYEVTFLKSSSNTHFGYYEIKRVN